MYLVSVQCDVRLFVYMACYDSIIMEMDWTITGHTLPRGYIYETIILPFIALMSCHLHRQTIPQWKNIPQSFDPDHQPKSFPFHFHSWRHFLFLLLLSMLTGLRLSFGHSGTFGRRYFVNCRARSSDKSKTKSTVVPPNRTHLCKLTHPTIRDTSTTSQAQPRIPSTTLNTNHNNQTTWAVLPDHAKPQHAQAQQQQDLPEELKRTSRLNYTNCTNITK